MKNRRRLHAEFPDLERRHLNYDSAGTHPDRRLRARLSRAQDVVGCAAVPGQQSDGQSGRAVFLYIAAYVENSLFCRWEYLRVLL